MALLHHQMKMRLSLLPCIFSILEESMPWLEARKADIVVASQVSDTDIPIEVLQMLSGGMDFSLAGKEVNAG